MNETTVTTYEGLFLFPQTAGADLQGCADHVSDLLERAGATVRTLAKWDERRMAFEIKGSKRGIYFLAYFDVPNDRLVGLERDCNLSERLLRAMVTRADHIPGEAIEATEGREALMGAEDAGVGVVDETGEVYGILLAGAHRRRPDRNEQR